jgi:REP element-mobilizing transposase RayT
MEKASMPQSFTCLHCHLIFSTKGRAPWLAADLTPRLYEYMGGILRQEKSHLLAAGGTADHVHLLASLSKELSVSDTLRLIKANSSKWIHETFPDQRHFAWQVGYGAFTVSYSHLGHVKRYIASQAEHHRTRTFQEEFIAFLKRHSIEYDERYLWE